MTVVVRTGDPEEYAIGLIACSRHQSGSFLPWAQHRPKLDLVTDTDSTGIMKFVRDHLGFESSRFSRTYFRPWRSEQWTGHTALFARMAGEASWARGWVPAVSAYLHTLVLGRSGPGEWQDDLGMIHDPTSISWELRVTRTECRNLLAYWKTRQADFRNYSFERQADSCNCVCAAVEVLQGYLKLLGRPEAQYLNKVTSPEQGKLMGLILGGDLLTA